MIRRTALLLLASASLAGAWGQPQTAEAFLTEIYTLYEKGGLSEPPYLRDQEDYFVSDLARAMRRDREQNPGMAGALDWDLFTDDQLGQLRNVSVKATTQGDKASATVEFDRPNVIPSMRHGRILVDLVRTPAGWRIADMRWPDGAARNLTLRGVFQLK